MTGARFPQRRAVTQAGTARGTLRGWSPAGQGWALLPLAHARTNVQNSPGLWQESEHKCLGHPKDSHLCRYPVPQILAALGTASASAVLGSAALQSHTRSSPAERSLCARFPFLPNLSNRSNNDYQKQSHLLPHLPPLALTPLTLPAEE